MDKNYSVVIPVKNEEENILPLLEELGQVMRSLEKSWEVIVVDDGSTDSTLSLLRQYKGQFPELRLLVFEKNAGQSSAFDAGFKHARGTFVITLDGDGQNDPRDIPRLLTLAEGGADLVIGIRQERKDPWTKKSISLLSNFVRSRICQDHVSDTGCSLKVYKRSSLLSIKMFHGMHRFLPALFVMEGFSLEQVPVRHRTRLRGKSNYTFFNRSLKPLIDMFAVLWMRKRTLRYKIKEEL